MEKVSMSLYVALNQISGRAAHYRDDRKQIIVFKPDDSLGIKSFLVNFCDPHQVTPPLRQETCAAIYLVEELLRAENIPVNHGWYVV